MAAYIRQARRARESGALVEVLDLAHPATEFEPEGGRWATVCEHGSIVVHRTLALARSFAAAPTEWCAWCAQAAADRVAAGALAGGPVPGATMARYLAQAAALEGA